MNIVSTLFRVVGRHGEARKDEVWRSLGRVMDDRQHRHGGSRFLYPPSCRHVHFSPPSQDTEHAEPVCEPASIIEGKLRYR